MDRYNIKETETKWRARWDDKESFTASDDFTKEKSYILAMFPYPSGRIHMGHVRNYSLSDVIARYKKAQGFNVMNPMGWDAFGLPAENAAIERNEHPGTWTYQNITQMREQLKGMGLALDWSREIASCHPGYYKHEQKMFLDFLENGIAYRKEAWVNWDPVENTVLANEQVVDGKGWRSGAPVERKKLNQWALKITDFADDLLDGLKDLDRWPEKVRTMQENWIGKSQGLEFTFDVKNSQTKIPVFTTRPDTLFGASFVGLSPDHPITQDLALNNAGIATFVKECQATGTSEVAIEKQEKRGIDTGLRALHPFTGAELPVYVANFVLMDYGTGAVFACPAHDQRDLDFARKYDLPVLPVVRPKDADTIVIEEEAYTDDGVLFNSDFLNGLSIEDGKKHAITKIEGLDKGTGKTIYRLRDWGISRQRYWGCPIPIIYCDDCGAVPVPADQLPVELPTDISFDKPGNPLDHHATWKHVDCPSCKKAAVRETDTFDTFFESSWYQFRYADPRNTERAFDKEKVEYWRGVDQYIGGVEHAVMHLLYARFFTKALQKCGYFDLGDNPEPFEGLFTQGMITHETFKDQNGQWIYPTEAVKKEDGTWIKIDDKTPVTVNDPIKMSKSKRNTIDPDEILNGYGADAARLFILSDSPPERDLEWTDSGIEGAWRFINKLWRMVVDHKDLIINNADNRANDLKNDALETRIFLHKTIRDMGGDIERFHMNRAVARCRELSNMLTSLDLNDKNSVPVYAEGVKALLQLMNPIIPHITEELWETLEHDAWLVDTAWPEFDESLFALETITIGVQVNGKVRATISLPKDSSKEDTEKMALEQDNVQKAIEGKTIRKMIVIPNKIVNVVVG